MEKTCFVIIGYGIKPDYASGKEYDLDKTFKNIIEPVFKELGFLCYRASDIQHSGIIDIPMYENILKADFVVADLTTLNPNVLYELGIRHAVRKNTTIVISDKKLNYPFDLSHIMIDSYEHLEKAIDYDEVIRFKALLKEKVLSLIKSPKTDSPIYSFFPNLAVPTFTEKEINEIKEHKQTENSVSELLEAAEKAKNEERFTDALDLLNLAIKIAPSNDFIVQRLALSTYKSKLPNKVSSLENALSILTPLNPDVTTDIETLGLSGAINKRLFDALNEEIYLDKAMWFYEKGFFIGNDYYNGINAAYILNIKAVLEKDKFEAFAYFGRARVIRKRVAQICDSVITSKIWQVRDDKQWVLLSLAEAYFGLDMMDKVEETIATVKELTKGSFGMATFLEQQVKLKEAIEKFTEKYK